MAVNLKKGQKVDLTKGNPGLSKIMVGLGWDAVEQKHGFFFSSTPDIDCDASAFVCINDKLSSKDDVVYFHNLKHKSGAVRHMGDNLTGEGDGDDETINVDLQCLPASILHLVFTVNSFRGQKFDQVENAYCRIVNNSKNQELARFNLAEKGQHTGVVMASLSRKGNDWSFKAIGQATNGRTADDLVALAIQAIRT